MEQIIKIFQVEFLLSKSKRDLRRYYVQFATPEDYFFAKGWMSRNHLWILRVDEIPGCLRQPKKKFNNEK